MLWILIALIAATGTASRSLASKVLLRRYGALQIACLTYALAGVLAAPLVLVPGLIHVPADPGYHGWAALTIAGNVLAAWLLNVAIARSDLSLALPFLALTPPLALITGAVLQGEIPSRLGAAGVLLAAVGAFGVGAEGLRDWVRGGGRRIFGDRGVQGAALVAFLYAFTAVADKKVALGGGPVTFLWYGSLGRGAVFGILWLVLRRRFPPFGSVPRPGAAAAPRADAGASSRPAPTGHADRAWLVLVVALLAVEHLAHLYALTLGLVAYVLTIKRFSVLETSLGGWWLFDEPFTRYRLAGALCLIGGAALVYLG